MRASQIASSYMEASEREAAEPRQPPKPSPRGLTLLNTPESENVVSSKEVQPLTPEPNRGRSNSSQSSALVNAFSTLTSLNLSLSSGSSGSIKENNVFKGPTLDSIKMGVECNNLIGLTHLIVKDLISSSLKTNRTNDSETTKIHLSNFFTLIEKVLKHGLKARMLSAKASGLWTILDNLPKQMRETTLISESIRSLPNAKSTDGRIRAWMRLAMMQKKLPEYFGQLLENKNELREIYLEGAFMLSDQAPVFAGLIIGVNVIDCNFFFKDDNFDEMDPIIDLTPYLRVANPGYEPDTVEETLSPSGENEISTVLDQKNYLEELNSHLQAVNADFQAKLKDREEKCRALEMELRLSETRIKLQSEANFAKKSAVNLNPAPSNISTATPSSSQTISLPIDDAFEDISIEQNGQIVGENGVESETDDTSVRRPSLQDASYQTDDSELDKAAAVQEDLQKSRERMTILEESLRESLKKIKALTSQLEVKSSMNIEKDTTINLLKKEIQEKNDQIDSTRSLLTDTKKLNKELFERLEKSDTRFKERIHTVAKLQADLDSWKLQHADLSNRFFKLEKENNALTKELETLRKSNEELSQSNGSVVENLRKERESNKSLSSIIESKSVQITELQDKRHKLQEQLYELRDYKKKHDELLQRVKEYELSLEQVGAQLRDSQLEVESLKESSDFLLQGQWMDSKNIKECTQCQQVFSLTNRKHHCRNCGRVLCTKCSDQVIDMAYSSKPVRVCDHCYSILILKKCQATYSNNITP
ncbi:RUN and FYVE domain-containing protein 2 [Fragariocoptes setiger]|uniref:RUN and FYVE domain-containing protein 2 n=1 Tax=Fragariocoptes setiger TaxID=1670756 RepID=A0ABQ7S6K5_9ACAR|nr:RUN and FYVE domain-containing protein 2 [Fragariocoptes setiger]